jgi:predicted phage tail protein
MAVGTALQGHPEWGSWQGPLFGAYFAHDHHTHRGSADDESATGDEQQQQQQQQEEEELSIAVGDVFVGSGGGGPLSAVLGKVPAAAGMACAGLGLVAAALVGVRARLISK